MIRLWRAAAVALALIAAPGVAAAEEKILDFDSVVAVQKDGALDVTEAIRVNAENSQINHGIYRDFPTRFTIPNGGKMKVGFTLLDAALDGLPVKSASESLGNGVRIKLGSADTTVAPGEHRYRIHYRVTRELGYFKEYDELYWNVTGNGWTFPIEEATAIVRLPAGAHIKNHAEYTGPMGSTANESRVHAASGSEYRATTAVRLEIGEGFTIAVAWQKGLVTAPSGNEKWLWWFRDNAGIFALLATLVSAGGFYFFAWNKVGRDPPKGAIIPLFVPPNGLSPAGARFISRQGFDNRAFAAAIVGLAVAGRAKIIDDDSVFSIQKLPDKGTPLSLSERALYGALPGGTTDLKQSNHAIVRAIRAALEKSLKQEYEGTVFLRNLGWFWKGLLVSVMGLVISALFLPAEDGMAGLFAVGWSGIWWGVVLAVAWGAIQGAYQSRGILRKLRSLGAVLVMIPFLIGGVAAPAAILFSTGSLGLYMLIGTAVLLGIMNLLLFHLLRAPTISGRKLIDQLEGFRMYLTTAEEDRLNVLNPPEKTPELFERYLPYALALDCENEWNSKFAAVLAAASAGATAPLWYSGNHWDSGRTGGFTESLGSNLSSSISSASSAPGSSSGSSGGGSSGGGGGGGGGSGW